MIGKARGSKQGNNLLVQKVRESGGIDFSLPILLGYTGLSDALLQKYVADSAALWRDHCGSLEQTLLCQCDRHTYGAGCRSGRVLQERCLSAVKL